MQCSTTPRSNLAMAAEKKVILLMGNNGVGKSSVGCRLLGFDPASEGAKPFDVVSVHQSRAREMDIGDGTWFGHPEEPAVRVVVTPGLGDARGCSQDNQNLVNMRTYLDTNPVHCILFVCTAFYPRVEYSTKGLWNFLALKIAPKDYAKLGIIINVYNHSDLAKQQRSYYSQPRGQSEAEIQAGMKEEFAGFLREFAKVGKLPLSEEHIATLVSHMFFVDTHYTPFANPEDNHEAFVGVSLWARTCGEIDRAAMALVNEELQQAVDAKQKAENLLTENNTRHLEKEAVRVHKEKEQEKMRKESEARIADAQCKADDAGGQLREANIARQAKQDKGVVRLRE